MEIRQERPGYYPLAGYVPASRYGMAVPFPAGDDHYMAMKLRSDAPRIKGMVRYDPAFGIDGKADEE